MIVSYRAMTHSNDAQCRPVRLDQYVNQDPRLIFKTRVVFKARLLFEENSVYNGLRQSKRSLRRRFPPALLDGEVVCESVVSSTWYVLYRRSALSSATTCTCLVARSLGFRKGRQEGSPAP